MNYKLTKYTCFYTYIAMASTFALPPLLFVTFREMYGVSYTLLGTLVLINFCTQLTIDLIFSFFTKYFNIRKTVRIMPLITAFGLLVYALIPNLFPQYAYFGLAAGTVLFSVSAGLSEVLLSPVVAAIPSATSKDMSMLHSLYAWGVVSVVVITTAFLKLFDARLWGFLAAFFAIFPIIASVLFCKSPLPEVKISENSEHTAASGRKFGLFLFVLCIFCGSAAENVMTNWISGYMENALKIPKTAGDILGMAVFAILLGSGRTMYAKKGKHIYRVLLGGMACAVICYVTAGLCNNPIIAVSACILTGLCTSMLWPGTLILMEESFPSSGVTAYALMAAGGDFGGSIAPQLMGAISDAAAASPFAVSLGNTLSMSAEQIGMKAGMLTASLFPLAGVFVLIAIGGYLKKIRR